jgi:hypothetical protein
MQPSITPEMAQAEIARRQSAAPQNSGGITPEMARAEIARRQNAPRETKGLLDEAKEEFSTVGKNAASFAKGAGQQFLNSAINASNLINNKKTSGFDFAPQNTAAEVGKVAGDIAGFALPYTAGAKGIQAGMQAMPHVANAFNKAHGLIRGGMKAAGAGAAAGLVAPEGERTQNALLGAGLGAAGEAVPAIYQGAKSAVKNALSGTRSPIEAQKIAEIAGDLPVSYGDIVKSPALQALNKGLSKIPFSGVKNNAQKIEQATEQKSADILKNLKGLVSEENIPAKIQSQIAKNSKLATKFKNNLWEDLMQSADDAGVKLYQTPELQKKAFQYFKQHGDALKQGGSSPLTESELKDFTRIFGRKNQELAKNQMNGKFGDSIEGYEPMNFRTAYNDVTNYGEKADKFGDFGDNYLAKIYGDFKGSLNKDIEKSILKSGNKDLLKKLEMSKNYHKENFLPYQSNEIKSIVNEKKNLENVHNTLLNSVNHKVLSNLPQSLKKNVAFMKFKSAIKEDVGGGSITDSRKLFNAYQNLSKRQKNSIFNQKEQDEFHKLGVLSDLSKSSPKGNANELGELALIGDMVAGLAHSPALAAKMLALEGGAVLTARGINKLLISPRIRNSLLQGGSQTTRLSPRVKNALKVGAIGAGSTNSNRLNE